MRSGSRLLAALVAVLSLSLMVPVAPANGASAPNPVNTAAFWNKLRYSPGHVAPSPGAAFNNPYGTDSSRRRLLSKVIRTINGVPGYRLRHRDGSPIRNPATGKPISCPTGQPRLYPARIRIALYSIADYRFTEALVAAHRRCVSVKILMNSHLDVNTSPSWRRLVNVLGNRGSDPVAYTRKRSYAYRCSNGCLGSAVLHTKMYLFDKVNGANGQAHDVVMTGSSNMTTNAVRVQWNDLFTVRGNSTLYGQYLGMWNRMTPDRSGGGPRIFRAGPYTSTFYPFRRATASTDRTMAALNSIRCRGANGGSGIGGRTVLYIAMHAWHGNRGLYLARRVRQMYARGCYVRILYSFMGHGTYQLLKTGTGSRMVIRRVLFPGPRGLVAAKYSHMKMFAASGVVNGDRSSWVTWTGSNNWTDRSLRADEVTLRIPSRAVYRSYRDHWSFMRNRRSSSVWAIYDEPGGGGRTPDDGG